MKTPPRTEPDARLSALLLLLALLAPILGAAPVLAQSDPGGLSFRACWQVCGPSAEGRDPTACRACLRETCREQPRLRSHPACRRVGTPGAAPSASAPARAPEPVRAPEPARAPTPPAPRAEPARSTPRAPASCDVAACDAHYRTFRASDCTYQPYEGPRRVCTKRSPPEAAAETPEPPVIVAEPTAPIPAPDDFVDDELPLDTALDAPADDAIGCDYAACESHYRSFRRRDCSYQPYEGPRRRCTKGDPIAAAARAEAERAAAEEAAARADQTATLAPSDDAPGADAGAVAAAPLFDPESVSQAQAELDIEEAFDAFGNVAAPIGYGAFAALVLLKLFFARPAPSTYVAPTGPSSPAPQPRKTEWRVDVASRSAFGARDPEDFGGGR